uniref:WYL domain-containing protein n=1 Tax=Trebonia sp. TaxID=2767075 RepID=UPI00345BB1BC
IGPYAGTVTADGDETCVLDTGSDSLETLAVYLGMLGYDFRVQSPPELAGHLRALAGRYRRALS